MNRKSNPHATIIFAIVVSILFISFYVMMPVFATIMAMFTDQTRFAGLQTETECNAVNGAWYDSSCHSLDAKANQVLNQNRNAWLMAPIIFFVGMVIWLFTAATNKDPTIYEKL